MNMPNKLYVASYVECIDGQLNCPIILSACSDAECAYAKVMENMNAFAEDMDTTVWTIDRWSMRAETKPEAPAQATVKWSVMATSVDY